MVAAWPMFGSRGLGGMERSAPGMPFRLSSSPRWSQCAEYTTTWSGCVLPLIMPSTLLAEPCSILLSSEMDAVAFSGTGLKPRWSAGAAGVTDTEWPRGRLDVRVRGLVVGVCSSSSSLSSLSVSWTWLVVLSCAADTRRVLAMLCMRESRIAYLRVYLCQCVVVW